MQEDGFRFSGLSRLWTWPCCCKALLVVSAVTWGWYPVWHSLVLRWSGDPQYSHGFLVPVVALYIVLQRRGTLPVKGSERGGTGGLFLVALAGLLYFAGAHFYAQWIEQLSLLPLFLGLAFVVGGQHLGRIAWPAVAYLLFMIPLPYRLEVSLAVPLQSLAGLCSEVALQTCGVAAIRSGNLIRVEEHVLGIAEACSGMRMMVVFFAIAVAVALLICRRWSEKLVLVLSAVPIAVFCNVVRITVTGLMYVYAGPNLAEFLFHDVAGWLMMPLALLILALELRYFSLAFPVMQHSEHPEAALIHSVGEVSPLMSQGV